MQRHRCNAILNLSECISVQFQADGEYWVNDVKLLYLSEIEIVTIVNISLFQISRGLARIYQVLKQVHQDVRIKLKTVTILDSFCNDHFERIAAEAEKLAKVRGKVTVTSLDVQTAVKFLVPGDLAKQAIAEKAKAVAKFNFNPTT